MHLGDRPFFCLVSGRVDCWWFLGGAFIYVVCSPPELNCGKVSHFDSVWKRQPGFMMLDLSKDYVIYVPSCQQSPGGLNCHLNDLGTSHIAFGGLDPQWTSPLVLVALEGRACGTGGGFTLPWDFALEFLMQCIQKGRLVTYWDNPWELVSSNIHTYISGAGNS